MDKAGDERGTRGDKRDLCQDCLRLFHTAGIMKGRNRWARAVYRPTGCERVHTLSRSPGAVLAGIWISNGAGLTVLVENSVSDETGVGRSAPLHPLGGGRGARGCDPLALSRGAVLAGIWISDGAGLTVLMEDSVSDEKGVGRSAPLPPSGTGCERVRPSRALPWGCAGGDLDF